MCLWRCFPQRLALEFGDWIKNTLTNAAEHHQTNWGPEQNRKADEGGICSLPMLGRPSSPDLRHQGSWFAGLGLGQGLTPLPACKWQIMRLRSPHNHEPIRTTNLLISKYIYMNRGLWRYASSYIHTCVYICISYWFCFSRESWLIQPLRKRSKLEGNKETWQPNSVCIPTESYTRKKNGH